MPHITKDYVWLIFQSDNVFYPSLYYLSFVTVTKSLLQGFSSAVIKNRYPPAKKFMIRKKLILQ